MTPVDMIDIWSPDKPDSVGDCFRACIASLFDLLPGEVPHFLQIELKARWSWNYSLDQWLGPQGLWYCEFPYEIKTYTVFVPLKGMYAIGAGISPRRPDSQHAVVVKLSRYQPPEIIHDPHPSRVGIVGEFKSIGMFLSRRFIAS